MIFSIPPWIRCLVLVFVHSSWAASSRMPSVSLSKAEQLFQAKKYERVIEQLSDTELQKLPRRERSQAYILLGQSHQNRGDLDKALGVFQLGVELFPKDINLLSQLAGLLHQVELDDRARVLFQRVLRIHPNNAYAHLGMAEIERAQGNPEEALLHYEACLREWNQNASIWRAYAMTLAERRNFRGAATAIERALSLEPKNIDSLKALATFQFRQGLAMQARQTLVTALALTPQRGDLMLQMSLWLLEESKTEESLSWAQRVLKNSPSDPLALWIRAVVALRQGRREEAQRDLQIVAEQYRQAPFISRTATAMLLKMDWAP